MTLETPEDVTDEALSAFWAVVASRFPTAKTGDLSPLTTIRLEDSARAAIQEWIMGNVPGMQPVS